MKKIALMTCILLLMLCGTACKPAAVTAPPPQPVYDTAPPAANHTVYINGVKMEDLRQGEQGFLFNLKNLKDAFGGYLVDGAGIESHVASLTVNGKTYHYAAGAELAANHQKALYTGEAWYVTADELLAEKGLHPFTDETAQTTYYTPYPLAEEIPQGVRVPTLMYHAVGDDLWGIPSLFVSPAEMEKQLQYLTENGYTPIWFEDLGKADTFKNPVLLTFDDGYANNYTDLFPLLKKYNVKVTVFMITGSIGEKNYLTEEQIKEMAASGLVSFQSHTVSHPYLSDLGQDQLQAELLDSKKTLAKLLGKEPFVLCYPTGKYSAPSLEATKKLYQFGLLMSGATYVTGSDPLKITRKYISRSTDLETFQSMIK